MTRTLESRFWSKVNQSDMNGCWIWTGRQNGFGYGLIAEHGSRMISRRRLMAHRVAYELLVGPIPDGLTLDHLCRTRLCVNPAHLEPVTKKVNLLRSPYTWGGRNSRKTTCPKGHPLSGENLLVSRGKRICRTCKRSHEAARRARLRGAA